MKVFYMEILLVVLLTCSIRRYDAALSGFSSSPTQYHVQNDEGPERFFRYQTYNGQYRKERRMDDGTVVGSYGWVDPAGYLRMTDYIADGKGYRVVNSRMEFVGVKPEENPPDVKPSNEPRHSTRVVRQRNPNTFPSTTETPTNISQQYTADVPATTTAITTTPSSGWVGVTATATPSSGWLGITATAGTTRPRTREHERTAASETRRNPEYNQITRPTKDLDLDLTPPKSIHVKPSTVSTVMRPPKRGRGRLVKVLRRPPLRNVTLSDTMLPPPPRPDPTKITFTVPPPTDEQDTPRITFTVAPPPPSEEYTGNRPFIIQVTRGDEKSGRRSDVFKGYATPLKNGNGGGFLYKIPNQYHKEETEADGSRIGSFGYVDPFGIRRVIHYNAGNTGFAHQVDFKYVGKGEEQQ